MGSEQRVTKVTGERFVETEGVQSTSQAPWKQIASSVWQMFLRSALSPRGTPSPDTTMTPAANRLHVITVIVCSLNAFRRHLIWEESLCFFPVPLCVYEAHFETGHHLLPYSLHHHHHRSQHTFTQPPNFFLPHTTDKWNSRPLFDEEVFMGGHLSSLAGSVVSCERSLQV